MSSTALPPMYHLEPWDKLLIVGVAGVALFTIGLLVFCSISPLCCLYHICPCKDYDEKEKKRKEKGAAYGSTTGQYLSPYSEYSKTDQSTIWQPLQTFKDPDNSDWSDYSSHDVIEMKQDRHQKDAFFKPISEPQSPTSPTVFLFQKASLSFGLMYDRVDGKLTIKINCLKDFSLTDPEGAMTPYIKVRLYRAPRSFFTFRGSRQSRELELNNLAVEFQTKILRRSINPVFNEIFIVPIDANEIHYYSLRLLVCDFDRYTRHVVVGEVAVPLSRVEWTTQNEIQFDEQLLPPVDENLGEVQVGLMYLPTAEKLSLTIMKGQGLKVMDTSKGATNPFLKVNLMLDGRAMKKTKTTVRQNDVNPVFNETMTFDVPHYQLDKVYFSISVIHVDKETEKTSRSLIGRLYLGMNFDNVARAQWNEMLQNTRKQVACWHKLQI